MITHDIQSIGKQNSIATHAMRILVASVALAVLSGQCLANEVDGFTEPYKTVNVAAAETGTVKLIEVQEGDVVKKGQVLACLDDDVHQALLAIAEEGMSSLGQLKSAEVEVNIHRHRLEQLEALRAQGHARQEEVDRARADLEISEAHVLSASEMLEVRRLERDKVQSQLNRRVIRAPIDGTVNLLHKDEGEFVAPNDPNILELVCLDPLMATFNVPSHLAVHLEDGQEVSVYLEDVNKWVDGQVVVVAPVTDAESSTVRVKVRIPNSEGKFRSGEHCTLQPKNPQSRSTQSRSTQSRSTQSRSTPSKSSFTQARQPRK